MRRDYYVEVEWVPFELHPEIPPEGLHRDVLGRRTPEGVREHLYTLAAEAGLALQSNPIVANGHKGLEAAEWAREQGPETFDRVHRALFAAYFGESRNISTAEQVIEALAAQAIPTAGLAEALAAETYAARIDEYTTLARQNGISSTPTFILDDRYSIPGAQDYLVFASALTRLGVPRRPDAAPLPGPDTALLSGDAPAPGAGPRADRADPGEDAVIDPDSIG